MTVEKTGLLADRGGSAEAGPPVRWKTDPRVIWADKAANWGITVGGLGVIAAVLGIFVFILFTVFPLFSGSSIRPMSRKVPAFSMPWSGGVQPVAVAVDEHMEKAIVFLDNGATRFAALAGKEVHDGPMATFGKARVASAGLAAFAPLAALGLDDGRIWLASFGFDTTFDAAQVRHQAPWVRDGAFARLDPRGRPLRLLAVAGTPEQAVVAAAVSDGALVFARLSRGPGGRLEVARAGAALPRSAAIGALLVHGSGVRLLVGTRQGRLLELRPGPDGQLSVAQDIEALPSGEAVTALAYTIGEQSVVVGGDRGSLRSYFLLETGDQPRYVRLHELPSMPRGVAGITVSTRDRTVVVQDSGRLLRGYFLTAERILFEADPGAPAASLRLSPKGNGLVMVGAQGMALFEVRNPHPEVTWRTLFGKVWYEGYEHAEHVWQSTGGSDDFESKFSLTPLVYGTIKGTFFALLFAVPLAVLAALYTSQFMSSQLRSLVKPMIEIMAALPSVVLGFLAALILAPFIEKNLFSILLGTLGLPFFAVASLLLWRALPRPFTRKVAEEWELAVLALGLLAGIAVVIAAGPGLERVLFYDFKIWLANHLGVNYDQRNSLVVGFAMGFAVIPIIYTICEDSLVSVPRHLVSASLSAGATSWQTAIQVVLPVALSGIFSAIMVGFGRAVGETMIVLMATGNTPVMDFSPFSGFRALSANIAVEIPEAPVGGTLYRILFLAALLLFLVTFAVNTVAELIRLHLRRKYSQL